MNKKEKQIEEMQFIMLNAVDTRYFRIEDVKKNYDGSGDTRFLDEAKALYNKGCRILEEGEWIDVSGSSDIWTIDGKQVFPKFCSNCGEIYSKTYNYCPTCGAKMIKE